MCDTESRLVRYSWVTPEYILGSQMDHPAAAHSHLSKQNRWQGLIFSDVPDCVITPVSLNEDGTDVAEEACMYRSVQHEQTLITQQSRDWREVNPDWFPLKSHDSQPFGVWFGGDFAALDESDDWVFVRTGDAYAAVQVITGGYEWTRDGTVLACEDRFSPVIIEGGRAAKYGSFDAFKERIATRETTVEDTVVRGWSTLTYGPGDVADPECSPLYFNATTVEIPKVDGEYLDYSPDALFDSPYLQSTYDSGVVTVESPHYRQQLDFG
jgi:hypothetical protein